MLSLLNLYGAARVRITAGVNSTLSGALTARDDSEILTQALDHAYTSTPRSMAPLDTLEILIARQVDQGEVLPVGEPNVMRGAQWLANGDVTKLPNPMPRDFVLYLAHALKANGKYPTMEAGVQYLISNYEFS